jgi:hypothetical protein
MVVGFVLWEVEVQRGEEWGFVVRGEEWGFVERGREWGFVGVWGRGGEVEVAVLLICLAHPVSSGRPPSASTLASPS